jgi:hypothetical protein
MDKRIAAIFYILLGAIGLAVVWFVDGGQGQPAPQPAEVKQSTIELNAEDLNESPNLKNAVDRLMQPVQKPTANGTLEQLQPAARQQQDTDQLPQ